VAENLFICRRLSVNCSFTERLTVSTIITLCLKLEVGLVSVKRKANSDVGLL